MEKMWVNIRINLYLSTENSNVAVFWRCGQTPEKRTWSCDLASSDNGSCGPRSLRVERAADREAFGWNGPTDREAFGWNGLRIGKPSGGTVQQIAKPSGGTVCGSESLRAERSNRSRSLRVERWNGPTGREAFGWNGPRVAKPSGGTARKIGKPSGGTVREASGVPFGVRCMGSASAHLASLFLCPPRRVPIPRSKTKKLGPALPPGS